VGGSAQSEPMRYFWWHLPPSGRLAWGGGLWQRCSVGTGNRKATRWMNFPVRPSDLSNLIAIDEGLNCLPGGLRTQHQLVPVTSDSTGAWRAELFEKESTPPLFSFTTSGIQNIWGEWVVGCATRYWLQEESQPNQRLQRLLLLFFAW
jgi:hypothetical protein